MSRRKTRGRPAAGWKQGWKYCKAPVRPVCPYCTRRCLSAPSSRSRELAIRKMKMALSELTIDGIDINRDLLAEILSDEQFVSGEYTTDFMLDFEKKHKDGKK